MEQLLCWALSHLSPILKVITGLHLGPWNFWKLCLGPFSPSSSLLACFTCRRRCAVPPPAVEGQPATSCFALAPTRHSQPSPPPVASRWCPLPSPRRPEPPARPPPQRRRGELRLEPTALSSRAHEHYKYPRKPFLSLFYHLLDPRLQNAAAAPPQTPASSPSLSTSLTAAPPPALTP